MLKVRLVSLIYGRVYDIVVRPCLELFPSFPRSFLPDFILLFYYDSCVCFFLLLFPYAKYTVWDTHLVHGIPVRPFPIVHAEWSLVF